MPARAAAVPSFGWLASAFCHGAILATLIAWHGSPPPLAVAIPVILVVERTSGADPVAAEPGTSMPTPSAAMPEPLPPTLPPAVVAPQPPAPPAARAGIKHLPRPAKRRSDAAMAATAAPTLAPSPPTSAAPANTPAEEVASNATTAAEPAAGATAAGAASARLPSPSADYLAAIMAWLERHKLYPEAARARREQGTVLVAFAIDRGGRLLSFGVRRSSGSTALDAAAEDMIRRAAPLPAVPASYPGRELDLVLPVTFALE